MYTKRAFQLISRSRFMIPFVSKRIVVVWLIASTLSYVEYVAESTQIRVNVDVVFFFFTTPFLLG